MSNTTSRLRHYFPEWQKKVERSNPKYPQTLQCIGDHIRKRRLDLHLLQKDVAQILQVTNDCIVLWETGKSEPQIQHAPKVIQFLGYNPYRVEGETLAARIMNYRCLNGLSHKKMGRLVGVDAATISTWETGKYIPDRANMKRLEVILRK